MKRQFLILFIGVFFCTASFADGVGHGSNQAAVPIEEKTEMAKLKECTWKFMYAIRHKKHDQNFKDQSKVLLRWPSADKANSKSMFLDDKGFFLGVKDPNHPRGVLPEGPRLEDKREVDVAIKILKHKLTSSALSMESVISSSVSDRYRSLERILQEKDVDDIRDGLCTCEKYGIAVDEIKRGRESLFTLERKKLFRVERKVGVRPFQIQDISCPAFANS